MRKIGLICMALVLAFAGLGIGYAHWSDTVTIDGTVEMGTLTLAFEAEPPMIVDNEGLLPIPKDIGYGTISFEDPIKDVHTGKSGYKTLVLEVFNAYPCYKIYFGNVVLHNIGNIPIHITDLDVWDPTGELVFEWINPPPASPAIGVFLKDVDGDTVLDEIINVTIINFVCEQIDPCGMEKGEVDLHFKQAAEECHTYQFKMSIGGIQWNFWP